MDTMKLIKPSLSVTAGIFTYIFGKWSPIMTALVCVVIVDYITGILSAVSLRRLSSKKGFRGILKKVFIFLIVAVSAVFDNILNITNGAVCASVCMFYIANETLSIIENAGEMGIPLPQILKDTVEKLKG